MFDTAEIEVRSSPEEALVSFNGFETGIKTNHTFSLIPVGIYNVTATLGASSQSAPVILTKDATEMVSFMFAGDFGTLQVNSTPVTGASIYLNTVNTGNFTNHTFSGKLVGDYNVTLVKDGYVTQTQMVTLAKDETKDVMFTLLPQVDVGTLQVNSTPTGASIYLNTVNTGNFTNHTFSGKPVGTYNVTLVTDGYDTQTKMVTLAKDATELVDFTLIPAGMTPVADFTATPLVGYAPLAVNFTDISTGSPSEWLWNFGDGQNSTEQNPVHIYQNAGSYTVSLTVANGYDSVTTEKVGYIGVRYYSSGYDGGSSDPTVGPNKPVIASPTAEPNGAVDPTQGVTTPDEFTETAQIPVDSDGAAQRTVTLWVEDRSGFLTIDAGVVARDATGALQETISMATVPVSSLTPPSPGEIGSIEYPGLLYAFDCGPDGMTFSPAISLSFVLSEEEWERYGAKAEVGWFNSVTGAWEAVTGVADADTRTITIEIDHFSTYAIFAELMPEVPLPDVTKVPGGQSDSSSLWLFGGLVLVIALGVAGYLVISKRKKV